MSKTRRPFAIMYRFRGAPRVRCWTTLSKKEEAEALAKKIEEQGWIVWIEDRT
jgi:hypothetical protein